MASENNRWRVFINDGGAGIYLNTYQIVSNSVEPVSPFAFPPPISNIYTIDTGETTLVQKRAALELTNFDTNATTTRTVTFQDNTGTVALLSDILTPNIINSQGYSQNNSTNNTTYTTLASIIFPGSASFTLTSIRIISNMDAGATSYDVRVRDITNSNDIATSNYTNTVDVINDLGALINIPAAQAIFEVQLRRVGGSLSDNIYLKTVKFN